jgi:hypothetical protein
MEMTIVLGGVCRVCASLVVHRGEMIYCGKESIYVSRQSVWMFCAWWEVSVPSSQFETWDSYFELHKSLTPVRWISSSSM